MPRLIALTSFWRRDRSRAPGAVPDDSQLQSRLDEVLAENERLKRGLPR